MSEGQPATPALRRAFPSYKRARCSIEPYRKGANTGQGLSPALSRILYGSTRHGALPAIPLPLHLNTETQGKRKISVRMVSSILRANARCPTRSGSRPLVTPPRGVVPQTSAAPGTGSPRGEPRFPARPHCQPDNLPVPATYLRRVRTGRRTAPAGIVRNAPAGSPSSRSFFRIAPFLHSRQYCFYARQHCRRKSTGASTGHHHRWQPACHFTYWSSKYLRSRAFSRSSHSVISA